MNRTIPKRRLAVFAALVILAVVPAIAQTGSERPGGRPFGPPPGRGSFGPGGGGGGLALERLGRELGFTDAQRTQIQALLGEERTTLKTTADGLLQAQQALDAAVMQSPADDGVLQAQVAAVSTIQAQAILVRAQTEAKIYQLLTADQQQKAQQWLAERQQRLHRRKG